MESDRSKEFVQNMIDALAGDNNNAAALDHFKQAMNQKIASELDAKRVGISQSMFNHLAAPEETDSEEDENV